jgi:hypothetical protein
LVVLPVFFLALSVDSCCASAIFPPFPATAPPALASAVKQHTAIPLRNRLQKHNQNPVAGILTMPVPFVSSACVCRGDGLMKIRRALSHPPFCSTSILVCLFSAYRKPAQFSAIAHVSWVAAVVLTPRRAQDRLRQLPLFEY